MRKFYYMSLAVAASMRSTCQQAQVGCVLVKNDRVVATGYNGTLPGKPNCDGGYHCQSSHKGTPLCLTIHAEINAIHQAAYQLRNADAYVTRHPCLGCAQALILAGVNRIYYLQNNAWVESVAYLLATQAPHVTIEQVNPNEVKKVLWEAYHSVSPVSPQLLPDSPLSPELLPDPSLPNISRHALIIKESSSEPSELSGQPSEELSEELSELIAKAKCKAMADDDCEQLGALLFLASLLDSPDNQQKAPSWETKVRTNFNFNPNLNPNPNPNPNL